MPKVADEERKKIETLFENESVMLSDFTPLGAFWKRAANSCHSRFCCTCHMPPQPAGCRVCHKIFLFPSYFFCCPFPVTQSNALCLPRKTPARCHVLSHLFTYLCPTVCRHLCRTLCCAVYCIFFRTLWCTSCHTSAPPYIIFLDSAQYQIKVRWSLVNALCWPIKKGCMVTVTRGPCLALWRERQRVAFVELSPYAKGPDAKGPDIVS